MVENETKEAVAADPDAGWRNPGPDYVIPAANLERLKVDLEQFTKRMRGLAKRKGVTFTEPTITISEPRAIPQGVDPKTKKQIPDKIVYDVKIEAEPAKVPGYEFVATLEHVAIEADGDATANTPFTERGTEKQRYATIVRVVPTAKVEEKEFVGYRKAAPSCVHCGYARYRKDTFIVREEATGTLKQIGRNCLKDFFGHDPSWIARMAEFIASLGEACGDAEGGESFGIGGQRSMFSLKDFLPWVVSSIRVHGWTSRTKAKEMDGLTATADEALSVAFPPANPSRELKELIAKLEPTDNDVEVAAKAVEFAREKFDAADTYALSDYEHNLSVCVLANIVDWRKSGIAASLITYYNRDLAKRAETQKDMDSQWFGEIKKREVFTLKLVNLWERETQFGAQTIYKFKDAAGNIATWFASSGGKDRLEIGVTYKLKATVKGHEEFRGAKQTVISRAIVVETIPAEVKP